MWVIQVSKLKIEMLYTVHNIKHGTTMWEHKITYVKIADEFWRKWEMN